LQPETEQVKQIRSEIRQFLGEILESKITEYLSKNVDIDPLLIAILKSYNINIPLKSNSEKLIISKDLQQMIQEKKMIIELNKYQNYQDFKDG
jgi:hypothetical protein